jgi:hypothetical protein
MLSDKAELERLARVVRHDDWAVAGVLAAEVLRLRAELAESDRRLKFTEADQIADLHKAKDASGEAIRERDAARKEAADLRAQLATLTDPSPAAQLRRYREAQALVENPPKVAGKWTADAEHSAYTVRHDPVGASLALTREDGYWYISGLKAGYKQTGELARSHVDNLLAADGWQLVDE